MDKSEEPVVPLLQCCLGKCKKKSHSEDGSKASTSSFTLEERIRHALCIKIETDDVVELPKFAWEHVPFQLMNIPIVRVDQGKFGLIYREPAKLFNEVNEVLAKITTDVLFLVSDSQQEARKVLHSVSLRPDSTVYLLQDTRLKSKKPLLEKCDFSNVKEFRWSTGHMLPEDLSFLLKSSIKLLHLDSPYLGKKGVSLVQGHIEKFLAGNTPQSVFEIECHGRAVREWFEEIVEGKALGPESVERVVAVTCSILVGSVTFHCYHREGIHL